MPTNKLTATRIHSSLAKTSSNEPKRQTILHPHKIPYIPSPSQLFSHQHHKYIYIFPKKQTKGPYSN